jgi:hypothetical protein
MAVMTKKEAALRQITAAIQHFEDGEYECAITLAGAAEGQLVPEKGSRHLFSELQTRVPPEFKDEREWVTWLNTPRDWLKHQTADLGDEWNFEQYDAAIMILRSITKFQWTYRQGTKRMQKFLERWKQGEWQPPAQSDVAPL